MKTQEFEFKGFVGNWNFAFLFLNLILNSLGSVCLPSFLVMFLGAMAIFLGVVGLVLTFFIWAGVKQLEPNEARVMVFFGEYKGTFRRTGFYWVNPFLEPRRYHFGPVI